MTTDDLSHFAHKWSIEPPEYARHESRRGRRHAFERLNPKRTALIVIDMIPFFVSENGYARGIVTNIDTLAEGLRDAGGTVAWVVPALRHATDRDRDFYGPEVAESYAASGGRGPIQDRIWPEFGLSSRDLFVEKAAASAFFPDRSKLPAKLAKRKIDTVLITGTVANVCCESSARDASTLGYRVIMVADANAAARDHDLNATLHTIYRSFGDVRSTAEIQEMIRTASAVCSAERPRKP